MPARAKPQRQRAKHFFREWREKKFPRQEDAQEALGWSQSKISRLESGQTPYDQDDLEHAAAIFGCSPADLVSRSPIQPPQTPEMQLRAALLAFGVDGTQMQLVTDIINRFVVQAEAEEQRERILSDDQSQSASRRRAAAP